MYALWLMPAIKQRIKLAHLIQALSDEHGGPLFDPHITLLADIEGDENRLIDQTRRLASQMTQFSVRVRSLDYLHEYYKSFFIRIDDTDSIDQARRIALALFLKQPLPERERLKQYQSEFMPHLSLMYGLQTDAVKALIKDKIQIDTVLTHRGTEIRIESLQLVSAFGPPESWNIITELPLRNG